MTFYFYIYIYINNLVAEIWISWSNQIFYFQRHYWILKDNHYSFFICNHIFTCSLELSCLYNFCYSDKQKKYIFIKSIIYDLYWPFLFCLIKTLCNLFYRDMSFSNQQIGYFLCFHILRYIIYPFTVWEISILGRVLSIHFITDLTWLQNYLIYRK